MWNVLLNVKSTTKLPHKTENFIEQFTIRQLFREIVAIHLLIRLTLFLMFSNLVLKTFHVESITPTRGFISNLHGI